jgi:hypothetical protein
MDGIEIQTIGHVARGVQYFGRAGTSLARAGSIVTPRVA